MGLQDSFDALSRVVEQVESRTRSVRELEVTTASDTAGALNVEMTLPVPMCPTADGGAESPLTPETASVDDNGDITITCAVSDLLPASSGTESVVRTEEQAARVEDGELVVTVCFRIEPSEAPATANDEASQSEAVTAADGGTEDSLASRLAAVRSDGVPAYDDTEYLRTLYESCGTFTEMSEYIEMDIAAETVRRYMIEADIHEPASYDTTAQNARSDGVDHEAIEESETASGEVGSTPSPPEPEPIPSEQILTDGIGLPDGVTVEDIVDAIVDATAVYEVQRSLDLDHGQTRDLLRQLNVLDLVLHRIGDPQQTASKDDIVRRMRQCGGVNA